MGDTCYQMRVADITKRMNKKLRPYLDHREKIVAAILVEPKGTYGAGMIPLALLPRTVGKYLEDKAGEVAENSAGLSAEFPTTACTIAATDKRVLIVPSNGITVGEPSMDLDRGQIAISDIRRKGLGRRIEFVFSDGSGVTVDAQSMQPFDRFQAVLNGV